MATSRMLRTCRSRAYSREVDQRVVRTSKLVEYEHAVMEAFARDWYKRNWFDECNAQELYRRTQAPIRWGRSNEYVWAPLGGARGGLSHVTGCWIESDSSSVSHFAPMMDQAPIPIVVPPMPEFPPQDMPQPNWQVITESLHNLAQETAHIPNFVRQIFCVYYRWNNSEPLQGSCTAASSHFYSSCSDDSHTQWSRNAADESRQYGR